MIVMTKSWILSNDFTRFCSIIVADIFIKTLTRYKRVEGMLRLFDWLSALSHIIGISVGGLIDELDEEIIKEQVSV